MLCWQVQTGSTLRSSSIIGAGPRVPTGISQNLVRVWNETSVALIGAIAGLGLNATLYPDMVLPCGSNRSDVMSIQLTGFSTFAVKLKEISNVSLCFLPGIPRGSNETFLGNVTALRGIHTFEFSRRNTSVGSTVTILFTGAGLNVPTFVLPCVNQSNSSSFSSLLIVATNASMIWTLSFQVPGIISVCAGFVEFTDVYDLGFVTVDPAIGQGISPSQIPASVSFTYHTDPNQ